MKLLEKVGALFSFVALALLPLSAGAGPIPFTQNQFPVWYAVSAVPTAAVSNASEVVLYQTALPPYAIGNNGFMRFTLFVGSPDGAAATVTHAVKAYIGGTNAAVGAVWGGGTPIFTNTFTTTANSPVQEWLLPQNGAITNIVYASTTTNSFNVNTTTNVVTVGTQTNTLYLTITGSAGGTGGATNIVSLNGAIIEALSQQ